MAAWQVNYIKCKTKLPLPFDVRPPKRAPSSLPQLDRSPTAQRRLARAQQQQQQQQQQLGEQQGPA
jgi:hypothetical protein